MNNTQRHTAVLLMAMGGPDCLENVEPFLLDVRGGRPTPPELVEEIRERYRATVESHRPSGSHKKLPRSWSNNSMNPVMVDTESTSGCGIGILLSKRPMLSY
jgi:protoheme ferro-lyase